MGKGAMRRKGIRKKEERGRGGGGELGGQIKRVLLLGGYRCNVMPDFIDSFASEK